MIKFGKKNKKSKKEEIEEESSSEEEEGSSKKVLTLADMLSGKEQPMPESRSIMFVGEVTEERAADLVSALIVLAQTKEEDQEKPEDIKLYINTYGGSADEMFAIYDAMNWCKKLCDIQTIGIGKVMSAGTLMLAAGTKGKRHITQHCRVMIHSVNGGHIGELHNLQNELEQIADLQDKYINALSTETSMTKKQIETLINKKINIYLNAEETVEKGLADGVWNG